MANETVDVIVLGMGVGGETVARAVVDHGMRVVGIDERLVGGECAYWGCIPTKIMVRGANLLAEARRAGVSASDVDVRADWSRVRRRVLDATGNWDDTEAVRGFEAKGGTFVRGHGRFTAPDVVEVDGASFRATRGIVIACGTAPSVPPIPGLAGVSYWTNREAVMADALPPSIVVLGGGSVGVEFAQIWQRFGVRVTLLDTADRVLSGDEPEASELIAKTLRADGVDVRTGVEIERVAAGADGAVTVHLKSGDAIRAERLMIAAGRTANLPELGVDAAGLDAGAERIDVDDHLRAAPGIWAIGDVTGKGEFTHIATYQAGIATADLLGNDTEPARYHAVPHVTFTDPEVGGVGLTQQDAEDAGRTVRCASVDVAKSSRGFLHGDGGDGLIKLVFDASSDTLIGATSVGAMGGEVLSMLTLAVHAELSRSVLGQMIYAYPTFHRAVLDALGRL